MHLVRRSGKGIQYNIGEYYVCFSDIQHRGHLRLDYRTRVCIMEVTLGRLALYPQTRQSIFLGRQQLLLGTDPPSLSTDAVRCGRLDSRFYSAMILVILRLPPAAVGRTKNKQDWNIASCRYRVWVRESRSFFR
jgi:hypothetical protein